MHLVQLRLICLAAVPDGQEETTLDRVGEADQRVDARLMGHGAAAPGEQRGVLDEHPTKKNVLS